MTDNPGPEYQRVYDDIRGQVASGACPVGTKIPSTPELQEQYGVSTTTVRKAIGQLENEGILVGRHGKGVYVRAMPEAVAADMRDLKAIGEQVAELAGAVAGYEDLRERVDRIEASLMELYGKTGFTYPDAAGNGRPERAASHG